LQQQQKEEVEEEEEEEEASLGQLPLAKVDTIGSTPLA
jgi:hypothetical protein